MARQRRVEFDGALYHVMARGDRRDPIVLTDEDRSAWVGTLGEMQATLRRGWYFGSEQFKERMLGFLEDEGRSAKKAKADGYAGAQQRDHGLAHARIILEGGCHTLGLDIEALRLRRANDDDKVMLGELIASQTSVPLDWLCENLGMGSRSHCSRLINAQRRRLRGNPSLKGQRTRLLKRAIYNE